MHHQANSFLAEHGGAEVAQSGAKSCRSFRQGHVMQSRELSSQTCCCFDGDASIGIYIYETHQCYGHFAAHDSNGGNNWEKSSVTGADRVELAAVLTSCM